MDEDNQSSENKKPNEHERTSDDTATQLGCSEFDNGVDYQVTDEKSVPSTSHNNWYTSTLALKYLQPAFVPIVQDKISSVHDETVSQFGRQLCAEATAEDIEKSDGNMAKFKHKCDTEQNYTYECQTFLNILKSHTLDSVDFFKMLQETDPQKWTKTPLDFVRLFLKNWMRCGIEDFKDFDISALCDMVKRFKPLKQMFDCKKIDAVKRVRNKTMHCAQMDLSQQDMEEHIEIILDFLNHIKSLKNTDDVTKAIDCITQLKTGDVNFVHELVVDLITGCLPGARQEYLHRHAMANKLHQSILYMEKELVRLSSGLEFCESIHTVSESEDVFEAKLLDDDSKLKAEIRKLKDENRELKIQCRAARRNREDRPGTPKLKRVLFDSVDIEWDGVHTFCDGDAYQVHIKNIETRTFDSKYFKVNSGNIGGLQPATPYVFKVRLVKDNGDESDYSENSDEVTTRNEPQQEANIPGKPYAESLFSDSVDIVWDGVSNFSEGDAYQVRIENTQTGDWDSIFFENNRGKVGHLQPGATYVLKVRLVMANGEESKYSENSEEFKIKEDRPGKPITKRVLVDGVDIEWDVVRIFRDKDAYQVCIINPQTGKRDFKFFKVNSANIRGLLPGTTYVFKVRLVKGNGEESEYSENSEEVTTKGEPKTEENIPGKPYAERMFSDSVDIVWDGSSNFSKGDAYQVRIENIQTGKWDCKFFTKNEGKIRDLQPGETYVVKVRLVKANGDESKYSENSEKLKIKFSTKAAYTDKPQTMVDRPGRPTVERLYNDSVDIEWTGLDAFRKGDVYQVRYENAKTGKCETQNFETNSGKIRRLQQGSTYVFKVRLVCSNGDESPFSEKSEAVTTHMSYASKRVSKSVLVSKGTNGPDLYRLPMEERKEARTTTSRKFDIGPIGNDINEKTIMLVGATGTGKSMFVDAIANYVMGVMLDDTFRFTVMQEEERAKQQDEGAANTEIITCYSFNSDIGTVHSYRLNVVDTPGFGDMCGPARDEEIVKQIQNMFEAPFEKGIQMIDAICIFVKSMDSRLTFTQTYIFNTIFSMFGKDIADNMCTVITFNDGDSDPPVMAAVKASGLPFGKEFTFNNLAFIADPKSILTSVFWDRSLDSFSGMFKHLDTLETKSMQLTKDVLKERHNLTVTCQNLVKRIKEGISALQSLKVEIDLLQQNQNDINKDRNYTYEVIDKKVVQRDLPVGIHVTNCLDCNRTCHENCAIADGDEKRGCVAMDGEGYCTQCPNKCFWNRHRNMRYAIDSVEEKVQKTYDDVLKRYQEAIGKHVTLQQIVEEKRKDLVEITEEIEGILEMMKNCNNRLKEISLRPKPLGLTDQLDLMILTEKSEGKEGYQKRIEVLNEFRERAAIEETVQKFKTEEASVTAHYNTLHVE